MISGNLMDSVTPPEGAVFMGKCNTSPASILSAVYTESMVYILMVMGCKTDEYKCK